MLSLLATIASMAMLATLATTATLPTIALLATFATIAYISHNSHISHFSLDSHISHISPVSYDSHMSFHSISSIRCSHISDGVNQCLVYPKVLMFLTRNGPLLKSLSFLPKIRSYKHKQKLSESSVPCWVCVWSSATPHGFYRPTQSQIFSHMNHTSKKVIRNHTEDMETAPPSATTTKV